MSAKKFVLCLAIILYVFIASNLLLWHGVTKKIFSGRDLNRLGFIATSDAAIQEANYTRHHTKYYEGIKESFDIITVGDSFTNGGGGNYYQDYLEEKYGLKILNVRGDVFSLIYSGIIDEIKPPAVIYESVEREVQNSLGVKELYPYPAKNKANISVVFSGLLPSISFSVNLEYLYSKIYRLINQEKISPKVYMTELDRELFSNTGQEKMFLFYFVDLEYLNSALDAEMVNKNLNNAAKILDEKNTQFIFFAAVDKYDLYYPYIFDKRGRPENNFFTEMQKVSPKNYTFIDTRKILREALARGEKDIYWLNDTHWSWKGAQLVCDEIVKNLRQK